MLQQIDNQKIDDKEQTIEDDMWQQSTYKNIFEDVEDIHEQLEMVFYVFMINKDIVMEQLQHQMKKLKFGTYNKKEQMKQFRGYII